MKDAYKKYSDENKQRGNQRRSCAFYKEFDRVLSVRHVLKLPQVCDVDVAEEVTQSPHEYHADDNATFDFQGNKFAKNKENRKRKILDLKESLENETCVDELEEAVKNKKKKGRQKNISP